MSDGDGFTERLRDESDWEKAARHRFVEELRDDSLDDYAFRRYLVDDYAFLEEGARLTALAAGKAPTIDEMGTLAEQLVFLTGGENDYFLRAFDELGVSDAELADAEMHPNAREFVDFMMRVGNEYGYEETLTVVAAAEWVYLDWCEYAAEREQERWYLDEWVEMHVVDDFAEYVGWLRDELDDRCPELSPERQERIEELFGRTVKLEARFFDAAYDDRERY